MDISEIWLVYQNLFKLAESRGVKVTDAKLDVNRFSTMMSVGDGSVSVVGTRPGKSPDGTDDIRGEARSIFVLTAPSSEAGKKTRDLYRVLPKEVTEPTEILVINYDAPTKNALKAAASYMQANKSCRLSLHSYSIFLIDPRQHVLVSPHELIPYDEFQLMREQFFLDCVELPRIQKDDPQAIWLGARSGMIILERRRIETSGVLIVYMVVV